MIYEKFFLRHLNIRSAVAHFKTRWQSFTKKPNFLELYLQNKSLKMANLKSPGRQSSFEYFSPFNAVLNSVGAQHEKALKQAFYNTVAVVFVLAGGAAGVAVYFVLDPFLKPLLWAGLCGAFLHPFKSTMTRIFRKWLSSLRSSSTPLVVGAAVVPFQLINNCSDIVGGFIAKRLRLIVILTLLTPFLYGLYVFRPFLEILSFLYQVCSALYIFMDYFSNPFAVWSIIIGYSLALIFWWTPSSSYTMRILSFPVWMAFANYLASIAGVYRVPLFLVVISLIVVGFITDATGSKDQVDGSSPKEEPNKRSSIIEGLTVAASVLSPINYDSDESYTSNIEDIPKPSPERTSNETPQSTMPTDTTDGRETRLQRIRRQNRPRLSMKKKSKSKSASYPYFVALIWGIMLTRVWMHAWILQLLPIPFAIYLIKLAVVWSGAWAYLLEFSSLWYGRLKEWAGQRKDAIMPAPIRGMVKLVMRGDQKVNSLMEKSIDNLMSVFMVISLVIVSITVTVLLAVQVHHESVHLVTVTGNLVNDVMAKNPQLLKWISENAEFKKTLDSAVERGYILGRKWIAAKVGTYLGDGSGNTTQLQQSVLEVTDRFYHAWMGEGNNSSVNKVANSSIGWTKSTVNETAADLSWGNVVSMIAKLDFKVLFSVVKENLGILMSLLESVYMILKGNVTMVINLVTMVLSLVFFSGTYVLNTGLSMIVFVTALFYLLSTSSDDQYKPVEWFGQIIATGTAGFGESLFKAIGDVFGAALKMATFYGLYTWFTHTLFGINIVFIPSALAAVAAVVPFIGTYWAAIPAVLELWLVQDEGVLAIILAICHILPISFVDTAIYSEISGGGHPYLTGLAVAGGIYCVGLEGAIIGPIVLCCLIVACQVYGSMIAESSPTSGEPTIMSAVEGERVAQFRGLADQYKKTPLQKQTPYRE